jgi:ubiquitin-protein ligase E3 C
MGIDGGGVFKEFFTDLSKEVFDSDRGLWLVNKMNELYPNHGSYATQRKRFPNAAPFAKSNFILFEAHSLSWYRFIGRILGKALYEGILVDVAFAGFFLAKVRLYHVVVSLLCLRFPYHSGWASRVS